MEQPETRAHRNPEREKIDPLTELKQALPDDMQVRSLQLSNGRKFRDGVQAFQVGPDDRPQAIVLSHDRRSGLLRLWGVLKPGVRIASIFAHPSAAALYKVESDQFAAIDGAEPPPFEDELIEQIAALVEDKIESSEPAINSDEQALYRYLGDNIHEWAIHVQKDGDNSAFLLSHNTDTNKQLTIVYLANPEDGNAWLLVDGNDAQPFSTVDELFNYWQSTQDFEEDEVSDVDEPESYSSVDQVMEKAFASIGRKYHKYSSDMNNTVYLVKHARIEDLMIIARKQPDGSAKYGAARMQKGIADIPTPFSNPTEAYTAFISTTLR